MLQRRSHTGGARGFTLLELLVVLVIIVLLLGLLIPVVRMVRRSARVADTRAEINRIANACQRYSLDFGAYPGPLSNDQVDGTAALSLTVAAGTPGASTTPTVTSITGTENCVLGLVGGLQSGGTLNLNHTYTAFGAMNPTTGTQYASYMEVRDDELTHDNTGTGRYSDPSGVFANDSIIPEFLDRFGSDKMPIAYLRARQGARGIMTEVTGGTESDMDTEDGGSSGGAHYQYCLAQIAGYVATPIGLRQADFPTEKPPHHGFYSASGVTNPGSANPQTYPDGQVLAKDPTTGLVRRNPYLPYFRGDMETNAATNAGSIPKCKDTFILISAGADHIYGTTDDVTNWGGTQP